MGWSVLPQKQGEPNWLNHTLLNLLNCNLNIVNWVHKNKMA
jgi:hypothetical protein